MGDWAISPPSSAAGRIARRGTGKKYREVVTHDRSTDAVNQSCSPSSTAMSTIPSRPLPDWSSQHRPASCRLRSA